MTIDELREFCAALRPDCLIYLAHPFSAPTEEERERNRRTAQACHDMLALHGMYISNPLPGSKDSRVSDPDYWYELDRRVLRRCDVLVIAKAPGWDTSRGVYCEMLDAIAECKPVVFWGDAFDMPTHDDLLGIAWSVESKIRRRFSIADEPVDFWTVDKALEARALFEARAEGGPR